MPVTDQDARALAYLAGRIRADVGASHWGAAGIEAVTAKLIGRELAPTVERVARHAADKEAHTPGAILRPFLPGAATEADRRPQPPRPGEHCHTCGRHVPCGCDQPAVTPPKRSQHTTDHIAALRREIRTEETR